MEAAVLIEPGRIELEERESPAPASEEVVVDVGAIGICGSDLHYYEHGRIGDYVVESPLVLGHESAGVVSAVGSDVTSHGVGDRVALEPGVPCRRCEHCRAGHYNLCPDVTFMATPPDDGAFVESVAWPADYAFTLPESVSLTEGALAEPVSVGVHACRRGDVGAGDSVLVTGAGPIGLLAADVADAFGATDVTVSEPVDRKREIASDRGVTTTVDPSADDVPAAVDGTGDGGPDVAIEATGDPAALQDCIDAVRRGGTVVCVGLGAESELSLDVVDLVDDELTLAGCFRYANTYPTAISLLADGRVDAAGLVDFEAPLAETADAMDRALDPSLVKGMIAID
jgi:L-iditol 2-dehydrogenase